MSGIRVGVSTVDFTPHAGLPLMGNFRDDYAARGTHDPLMAKAIVFADARGEKAAVLAVDICMLDCENVKLLRRVIGSECDIPPENVLIHSTHTHSAPAATGRLGMQAHVAPHRRAIETFLTKAASAVAAAEGDRMDGSLAIGYADEDRVSFNRRLRRRDGTTQMNWEALQPGFDPGDIIKPWGPIDSDLVCLVIERDGRPAAAMVNFGLHPAILAGDNWLYSADYPGHLAEGLSRTIGDDFTCLFLNGCCADVNHVDYRDPQQGRGYQMAQRVGYMLAAAAHQAIRTSEPVQGSSVQVARTQLTLERCKIGDAERRWCQQVLEDARNHPPDGQVDGLPDAYFARLRLQMWENQDQPGEAEIMAIRVGNAAVVGLPGEAFCQLGLEIKRRSPARHTLVAGLSNDAIGYLPTGPAFQQGGYETTVGSTFYEPGTGERVVESAVTLLNQLFSATDRLHEPLKPEAQAKETG